MNKRSGIFPSAEPFNPKISLTFRLRSTVGENTSKFVFIQRIYASIFESLITPFEFIACNYMSRFVSWSERVKFVWDIYIMNMSIKCFILYKKMAYINSEKLQKFILSYVCHTNKVQAKNNFNSSFDASYTA